MNDETTRRETGTDDVDDTCVIRVYADGTWEVITLDRPIDRGIWDGK